MATSHLCPNNPDKSADKWQPGPVAQCEHHDKRGRKQIMFKSLQEKRRLDSAGGELGQDRGGYINASE